MGASAALRALATPAGALGVAASPGTICVYRSLCLRSLCLSFLKIIVTQRLAHSRAVSTSWQATLQKCGPWQTSREPSRSRCSVGSFPDVCSSADVRFPRVPRQPSARGRLSA